MAQKHEFVVVINGIKLDEDQINRLSDAVHPRGIERAGRSRPERGRRLLDVGGHPQGKGHRSQAVQVEGRTTRPLPGKEPKARCRTRGRAIWGWYSVPERRLGRFQRLPDD